MIPISRLMLLALVSWVRNQAIPLSPPPRGLEVFCCVHWTRSVFLLNSFTFICVFLTLHCSCICRVFAVNVFVLAFCSMLFSFTAHLCCCLCFRFSCIFEMTVFLKLQHISPDGNVLGHCSKFALDSNHNLQLKRQLCWNWGWTFFRGLQVYI